MIKKIILSMTLLCAMVAPDFFAPFIVLPIILSTVFDDSLSTAFSLYLLTITAICLDYGIFILLCYVLMIAFGDVLAWQEPEWRFVGDGAALWQH